VEERMVGGLATRESGAPGILLWPGLGATSAYFGSVATTLPGRAVAVDPPGFGRSPWLEHCTYQGLIDAAVSVIDARDCRAMVGHSLGAYLAVGVAAKPPVGLRAAVLIDGGFMDAQGMAELGIPTTSGRAELTSWIQTNTPRFPDWDTATAELARMMGGDPTPALQTYVRELFVEVDGEIRDPAPADRLAELLLAVHEGDAPALAKHVTVPTLLIACGQPAERRPLRAAAWQRFADASPLIELHVAEDWGHNPILQDPDASSRLIAQWLQPHLQT
jgi:pimeloyl-ACP methyl ester carboxylesterase